MFGIGDKVWYVSAFANGTGCTCYAAVVTSVEDGLYTITEVLEEGSSHTNIHTPRTETMKEREEYYDGILLHNRELLPRG